MSTDATHDSTTTDVLVHPSICSVLIFPGTCAAAAAAAVIRPPRPLVELKGGAASGRYVTGPRGPQREAPATQRVALRRNAGLAHSSLGPTDGRGRLNGRRYAACRARIRRDLRHSPTGGRWLDGRTRPAHLQQGALALDQAHGRLDVALGDLEVAVAVKVLDEPLGALLLHPGRLLRWGRCRDAGRSPRVGVSRDGVLLIHGKAGHSRCFRRGLFRGGDDGRGAEGRVLVRHLVLADLRQLSPRCDLEARNGAHESKVNGNPCTTFLSPAVTPVSPLALSSANSAAAPPTGAAFVFGFSSKKPGGGGGGGGGGPPDDALGGAGAELVAK